MNPQDKANRRRDYRSCCCVAACHTNIWKSWDHGFVFCPVISQPQEIDLVMNTTTYLFSRHTNKNMQDTSIVAEISRTSLWWKFAKQNKGQYCPPTNSMYHLAISLTCIIYACISIFHDEFLLSKVVAQLFKNTVAAAMTQSVLV